MKSVVTIYSDNICPFCTIGAKRLRILQNELILMCIGTLEIHPIRQKKVS